VITRAARVDSTRALTTLMVVGHHRLPAELARLPKVHRVAALVVVGRCVHDCRRKGLTQRLLLPRPLELVLVL
jgi:hypothetical protein